MWMEINGAVINFDNVETFESGSDKNYNRFNIIIYFTSSRRVVFEFVKEEVRDNIILKILSKLSKHE